MTTVYSHLSATPSPVATTVNTSAGQSLSQTLTRGSLMAAAGTPSTSDVKSWYEAMAKAWGQSLNNQANVLQQESNQLNNTGADQPSVITQLTADSMRFSFLATSANTATTSVGDGLNSLGRKQ
ncbi:MAG TPA: hypothetical protein VGI32_10635 [Steroidobacteraceae bacterium]